jgi:glycosyltransferase involved in cell wall biosynthesis
MKWWEGKNKTYQHGGVTYHAISRLYALYTKQNRRSFKEGILFGLACLKLVTQKYDILEVDHMPYFPLFSAKLVSLIKRKPLYATWHEVVGLAAWRKYIGFVPGTVAYMLERFSVMMPNHIIAVSVHTADLLRTSLHYRGQLSLVVNGIDCQKISKVPAAAKQSDVMYAGRLIKHKNVDVLIESIAIARESYPTITCLIVGDGPERRNLTALVKELKLEQHVTFTGQIPESHQVYSLMKASKIFVSPSTREGFGLTILEAYACGLSVVTVKHPDNAGQYLVQPGAGVVCQLNAQDLSMAIVSLLETPRTRRKKVDASQFDWEHSAAALKEAYGL